jgi:hypothetical protein
MKINKNFSEPPPAEIDGNVAGSADEKSDASRVSRRRALIAGLTAAPVMLTLMNRPAWGADCSQATVASFRQAGNLITASFQRRHPNAVQVGDQLQCGPS